MIDLRVFSNDQLRKIARAAEREVDLLAAAEKFIPVYGIDGKITDRIGEAIRLTHEADEEAEKRGLTEIKSYQFRKEYIQNHPLV